MISKRTKIAKKYPKIKKNIKTRGIDVIKPIVKDKTISQIRFSCFRKYGGLVIIETDLQFTKINLRLVYVKKNFQKIIRT